MADRATRQVELSDLHAGGRMMRDDASSGALRRFSLFSRCQLGHERRLEALGRKRVVHRRGLRGRGDMAGGSTGRGATQGAHSDRQLRRVA